MLCGLCGFYDGKHLLLHAKHLPTAARSRDKKNRFIQSNAMKLWVLKQTSGGKTLRVILFTSFLTYINPAVKTLRTDLIKNKLQPHLSSHQPHTAALSLFYVQSAAALLHAPPAAEPHVKSHLGPGELCWNMAYHKPPCESSMPSLQ